MQIAATAKNIRISPQKVRTLVEEIKKMKPQDAIDILGLVNRSAATPLKKTIAAAIANAKHNHALDTNQLVFKSIQIGQGRVLKRFRPVSRGRAHAILKRTSYINVMLEGQETKTNKSNTTNKKEKGDANGPKS